MTTLIQVLSNTELDCSQLMAIYARKINGKFVDDSPARVEQKQFEDNLKDGFEFFATNEDACFSRSDWCQCRPELYQAWARIFIFCKNDVIFEKS